MGKINRTVTISVGREEYGYHIHDKDGKCINSDYFGQEHQARKYMEEELKKGLEDKENGPYTALFIVVPECVEVRGQPYTLVKGKLKRVK